MALVVMMLWYSKDYLREVIGAIFGAPSPKIRELEAREPFSYRTAFTMLIIGCVFHFKTFHIFSREKLKW